MVDVRYSVRETVGIAELSREAGRLEGHIAGLKEAAELVRANSAWMGNAQFVLDAITARIAELEKGTSNG